MPPPASVVSLRFFFVLVLVLLALLPTVPARKDGKRTYIVLVDPLSKPDPFPTLLHWYSSLLAHPKPISGPAPLLHRYTTLLHGFSAALTRSHARRIERSQGILAVSYDSVIYPQTTRSPSFLGLDPPASRLSTASRSGEETIIGVVDTGVWPEHPSFSDAVLGPVPKQWRGACEARGGFNRSLCNRKLVGARSFSAGYYAAFGSDAVELRSARDSDGHGTHVASIAAGSPVAGAGFSGFAAGLSRGMAPSARVAAYKVCWAAGCLVSDVVAAIERAVMDGVGVISLSLGSSSPAPLYSLDPLAIATFRASLRGVFVASSGGNGGPHWGSVGNAPPWITTVGSATIDRDFPAFLLLGNGRCVRGVSISIPPGKSPPHALLSAGKLTSVVDINLIYGQINGRVIFWETDGHVSRIEMGKALKRAGAAWMVVAHGDVDPEGILAEPHVLPTVAVGATEAQLIAAYIKGSTNPTAIVSSEHTIIIRNGFVPDVASFSARGPNAAVPWVLKPELVAPGVNILGAWTGASGPSGLPSDIRRPGFNILSGTSMSCPHVSGVAGLIRAARPTWGPWEIRSALMTTAVTSPFQDESGGHASPFAIGAGYLCPEKALDPGLVYDLELEDYVKFLCGLNYTDTEIRAVVGMADFKCGPWDRNAVLRFNHPAYVVAAEEVAGSGGEVVFYRRLKCVDGGGGRWYTSEVEAPAGYEAEAVPWRVWFGGKAGERVEFRLILRKSSAANDSGISDNYRRIREEGEDQGRDWWVAGMLRWREEEGRRTVTSPVVVFSVNAMP